MGSDMLVMCVGEGQGDGVEGGRVEWAGEVWLLVSSAAEMFGGSEAQKPPLIAALAVPSRVESSARWMM